MKYKAKIKVLGKYYEATGETKLDAIKNLEVGNAAKGMSVLTVSNGSESKDKVLPSTQTSRLFSPAKLVREIALKNTALRFDL